MIVLYEAHGRSYMHVCKQTEAVFPNLTILKELLIINLNSLLELGLSTLDSNENGHHDTPHYSCTGEELKLGLVSVVK